MHTTTIELNESELAEINGGNPFAGVAVAVGAYMGLLQKIESSPSDYTWTMDWYYQ